MDSSCTRAAVTLFAQQAPSVIDPPETGSAHPAILLVKLASITHPTVQAASMDKDTSKPHQFLNLVSSAVLLELILKTVYVKCVTSDVPLV